MAMTISAMAPAWSPALTNGLLISEMSILATTPQSSSEIAW